MELWDSVDSSQTECVVRVGADNDWSLEKNFPASNCAIARSGMRSASAKGERLYWAVMITALFSVSYVKPCEHLTM